VEATAHPRVKDLVEILEKASLDSVMSEVDGHHHGMIV
jgi:hypothetical protein